eukprot:gb/GECG01007751.1/.p1 GENE.gb/GECG01007751.1/~~gb/GECG01007751.1/.p1  ORF type:complete len:200 (+),score=27.36 gb/GECG01007751.1/:1-600(+)
MPNIIGPDFSDALTAGSPWSRVVELKVELTVEEIDIAGVVELMNRVDVDVIFSELDTEEVLVRVGEVEALRLELPQADLELELEEVSVVELDAPAFVLIEVVRLSVPDFELEKELDTKTVENVAVGLCVPVDVVLPVTEADIDGVVELDELGVALQDDVGLTLAEVDPEELGVLEDVELSDGLVVLVVLVVGVGVGHGS